MADIEVRVTEPDVYRWLGELYFLLKRSEMAVAILDARLTESEKQVALLTEPATSHDS